MIELCEKTTEEKYDMQLKYNWVGGWLSSRYLLLLDSILDEKSLDLHQQSSAHANMVRLDR